MENTEILNTNPTPSTNAPVKRGRGRPRKVKTENQPTVPTEVKKPSLDADKLAILLQTNNAKYDNFDSQAYQNKLDSMSLDDLQQESLRVGMKSNITSEGRQICQKTLMDLFYTEKRKFMPDFQDLYQSKDNLNDNDRNKLSELMKGGR